MRNTQAMRLPQATRKLLAGRFDALRTELTAWFGRPVGACQPPDILSYGPGSFFRPHTDTTNDPLHPQIRARDLTAVLFLSDPQHPDNNPAQDERYAGGRLLLHRSTGPATETDEAMDVTGPAGTLVAFPATTRHEVTPVTAGQRLTAVAWYTAT
ncbi:2OG-Fe(II) oxygenase [Streptomyces sp. YGL11-2]|uniref:2OG-Fe(II) oxygenase n=1 Tax=Streptomyces sp. YGL11-2 TaxID=3414028 RepID=UPI003CEF6923